MNKINKRITKQPNKRLFPQREGIMSTPHTLECSLVQYAYGVIVIMHIITDKVRTNETK